MHKIISITPRALEDLQQAIDHYNVQLQGLGIRFEDNINDTFGKIQKMPKAASFTHDTVRYKVVQDFPFIITYEELETRIAILRIFNTHQDDEKIFER
jgi:plasmid stabilization system protein ParE